MIQPKYPASEKVILLLTRKGFEGTAEYPTETPPLSGVIKGTTVTFSGKTYWELVQDFDRKVDAYLAEQEKE